MAERVDRGGTGTPVSARYAFTRDAALSLSPPPIFFRAYLRPFLCCTEYRLENDESFDLAGIGLKKKGALCVLTEEEWRKEIDNIYLFPNFLKFFRIKSGKEK